VNVTQQNYRYEFGECVIEPYLNRVCRDGKEYQLEHRAIETLRYLLDHAGEIVSPEELLGSVWADRIVEPNVIHRNLSRIRHSLGDDPYVPHYIETISKRGYRTIAPVRKLEAVDQGDLNSLNIAKDVRVLPEQALHDTSSNTRRVKTTWAIAVASLLSIFGVLWVNNVLDKQTLNVDAAYVEAAYVNAQSVVSQTILHEPPTNSIAVLPFENLSPNPDDAYFAAGIHEEVINRLFGISDLSVIAHTSVLGFADSSKSIRDIASELGVQTVMTGSVRYAADRVRIAVQLVDANSTSLIWLQSYERDLNDIFEIQDEIAANIASQLNTDLLVEQLAENKSRNPQAYILYLQARHLLGLGLGGDDVNRIQRAETLLGEALQLDPNDITVMMELMRLYLQKEQADIISVENGIEIRRSMILSALAVDPDHAVANAWLGWHAMFSDGDMQHAAHRYERATAAAPRNVNIIRSAVPVMLKFGRIKDAKILAEYLKKHDPLCAICLENLAKVYLITGEFSAATAAARSAVALAPQNQNASAILGIALMLNQQNQAALTVFGHLENVIRREYLSALTLHNLDQETGFTNYITALIAQQPTHLLAIATTYAWRGDLDEAFDWLDKTVQEGFERYQHDVFGGPNDPLLENLKEDPRWQVFLENIGQAPHQLDKFDFEITLPE